MAEKIDPIRPTDDEARNLAKGLIKIAHFGSLGVIDTTTGGPMVTRVAVGTDPSGNIMSLVSSLSQHTRSLRDNPVASLLLGEPSVRGDPLTHPRISLMGKARFIEHSDPAYAMIANHWVASHPKSKLYIGFADFSFMVFRVEMAHLNGGFGKAFVLSAKDLA